jgi:hypothetical protein
MWRLLIDMMLKGLGRRIEGGNQRILTISSMMMTTPAIP